MSQHGATTALSTKTSQRVSVQVRLAQNVNLEALTRIIATIGGRYGCTTCGLGGVDLRLAGDVEDKELSNLPGVRSVSIE